MAVTKTDLALMATNHFRTLARPEDCPRYEYMNLRAGRTPAKEILTSRRVLQEISAQHVVMCPATQAVEMFVPSHLLPDDVQEEMAPMGLFRFQQ